jgi:hypothetical protein
MMPSAGATGTSLERDGGFAAGVGETSSGRVAACRGVSRRVARVTVQGPRGDRHEYEEIYEIDREWRSGTGGCSATVLRPPHAGVLAHRRRRHGHHDQRRRLPGAAPSSGVSVNAVAPAALTRMTEDLVDEGGTANGVTPARRTTSPPNGLATVACRAWLLPVGLQPG